MGWIDKEDRCVKLDEKNGRVRCQPVSEAMIDRLVTLGEARGAGKLADKVFRYKNGTPLGRRHMDTLYNRIDAMCPWARPINFGLHHIRHTVLWAVEVGFGLRVAEMYAGHKDDRSGTIGLYTKGPVSRSSKVGPAVRRAHDRLFGA